MKTDKSQCSMPRGRVKREFLSFVVLAGFAVVVVRSQPSQPEPNPPHVDGPILESAAGVSQKSTLAQEWTMHRTADGTHPDGREQEMLWLMNRARSNPAAEGEFLAATGNADVASAISFFSVNIATLRQEFAAIAAKPPGAFDRRLYAAALAHSQDLIARDTQDHNGQFERVTAAGFPYSTIYGSVFSYVHSPLHAHAGFNIDWGGADGTGMQTGRGHRRGLMSDAPTFLSLVGIALVAESNAATVGPLVNTINYAAIQNTAGNYNRYLVGTVWEDTNRNGRFDAGEGKGGVLVSLSVGTFYAVSAAAGGYALPLTATGNLTVTFSGGPLAAPRTRSATVGTQSVLLDLETDVSPPAGPLQVATAFNAVTGQITLIWSGGTAPFQVQRRSSFLSGTWQNVGAQTSATNVSLTVTHAVEFFRVSAMNTSAPPDTNSPSGMALIPAGSFTMGDTFNEGLFLGENLEIPLHTVQVSAFYMDRYKVTKALWDEVYQWATTHGYSFDNSGSGKAANHPVHTVSWWDAVKWCNAQSEKEGRVPAYYTSAAQTTVYRTGQVGVQNDWVKWNSGYRLPTEAEWEKAARGGASGHRFSWSNVDTITHSQANYVSISSLYSYDISSTSGFHPSYATGSQPYTSPVGSFAPNGYGLYDMAGNVFDWCWDWYGRYSSGTQTDPRGPTSGSDRVGRGGCWNAGSAFFCRVASRGGGYGGGGSVYFGFRSVLPLGQ